MPLPLPHPSPLACAPGPCPKACRNFVQLCTEGYYDNTIFHRVIKDYIAQGGDPTGTGNGEASGSGGGCRQQPGRPCDWARAIATCAAWSSTPCCYGTRCPWKNHRKRDVSVSGGMEAGGYLGWRSLLQGRRAQGWASALAQ
jgi:hypothetical protein